jgi:hypothetical protein
MKTILPLSAAVTLVLASTASAKGVGFDADFTAGVTGPIKIEVVLSDDLAYRANNLPEKLSDRGNARGPRDGFSGNGYYGERDLQRLIDETLEELSDDFSKAGIRVSDTSATVLTVTLEDVRNNRPTFRQLTEQPSLDFQSFGIGGAELSAVVTSASGETIGTMDYRWYDSLDPTGFNQANGVWTDTNRAISRFSRRVTKTLKKQGAV